MQCKIRCRIQNRSRIESLVSVISRYPKVHTPPEYGRITLSISQEPASDIQPCCACAVRVPPKGAQVGYGSQLLIHVGRLHSEGSSEMGLRVRAQIHRQNAPVNTANSYQLLCRSAVGALASKNTSRSLRSESNRPGTGRSGHDL